MKRFTQIARLLVLLTPLVALIPLGRVALDWVAVYRVTSAVPVDATPRSFDWMVWTEVDSNIEASYVFPRGPAAEAGLREGDPFFMLGELQYFGVEDLQLAIGGIAPGQTRAYYVSRENGLFRAPVTFTRYPTFLYPLSSALWQFAIWGFTIGVFFHILGLSIAGPLALRSPQARSPLLLIGASSLWMFGNLLRLLMVELVGPPPAGSGYEALFQTLTLVSLVGWIGFPLLLLRKVYTDAGLADELRGLLHGAAVPAVVLGLAALAITLRGPIGPITLDALLIPILFYASCYIAASMMLMLALYVFSRGQAEAVLGGWSRTGSVVILAAALLAAFSVIGIVPILGAVDDLTAGWMIVAAQLLFIAPVTLVSLAPLKYGRVDEVLTRALTYVTVLGFIFFAFVGGMSLIDPYLERVGASRHVVAGLYVVLLLMVFERLARRLRVYAARFFITDRQRARHALTRFQEQMRNLLDHETLVRQTVEVVGQAIGTRSAILFLQPYPEAPWLISAYHPEAPYLTERIFRLIWPHMQEEGRIWARNPELNESTLDEDLSRVLQERGAALAVPIMGDDRPIGLLVVGLKKQRRSVYNLEDLEHLRSLSVQLDLAVERLNLVEREKTLARQRGEAQLAALRAQINPHFLFNALNTIASLIGERPDEAEATVEHLAAIFRHTLHTSSRSFVSLEAELALVSHYLRIEQARFGNKLRVEQSIGAGVWAHPVPAFAIQTLVENAVKHGLEKQREGGDLRISAHRTDDGFLDVVVADTGVGIPALFQGTSAPSADFFGIGLSNVAERIRQLYDRDDLLQIQSRPGVGTTVRLLLPLPRPEAAGDGTLGTAPMDRVP